MLIKDWKKFIKKNFLISVLFKKMFEFKKVSSIFIRGFGQNISCFVERNRKPMVLVTEI